MVRRGWTSIPKVGTRLFADHDLRRNSGPKEKGKADDAGGQHIEQQPAVLVSVYSGRRSRGDRSTESAKIRSLVGALAALGPEDTSAKTAKLL